MSAPSRPAAAAVRSFAAPHPARAPHSAPPGREPPHRCTNAPIPRGPPPPQPYSECPLCILRTSASAAVSLYRCSSIPAAPITILRTIASAAVYHPRGSPAPIIDLGPAARPHHPHPPPTYSLPTHMRQIFPYRPPAAEPRARPRSDGPARPLITAFPSPRAAGPARARPRHTPLRPTRAERRGGSVPLFCVPTGVAHNGLRSQRPRPPSPTNCGSGSKRACYTGTPRPLRAPPVTTCPQSIRGSSDPPVNPTVHSLPQLPLPSLLVPVPHTFHLPVDADLRVPLERSARCDTLRPSWPYTIPSPPPTQ